MRKKLIDIFIFIIFFACLIIELYSGKISEQASSKLFSAILYGVFALFFSVKIFKLSSGLYYVNLFILIVLLITLGGRIDDNNVYIGLICFSFVVLISLLAKYWTIPDDCKRL